MDCSHTEQFHLQIFRHLRMLAQGGCSIFQTNLQPRMILKREPGIQFRANIYKTSDGKWDVLAGTPVTGIKGAKETSYRRGKC